MAETGLNQNYFRDYDPATGRYVESDPVGLQAGINTYLYVGGNPISSRDPLGLAPLNGAQSPLPYDPGYGPSNCAQYPAGILHDICSGTPNNPHMNCSRKCLQEHYPGQWKGPPQDYLFYFIPQHPICSWECQLTPGDFCKAK
jgi:hypothetical protein